MLALGAWEPGSRALNGQVSSKGHLLFPPWLLRAPRVPGPPALSPALSVSASLMCHMLVAVSGLPHKSLTVPCPALKVYVG